ncbi:uncharacterized protein UTRI_04460_B [Ustilago trichophora]|uniref:Uncharacterized protein n=1 Tax=Ustilago trichophora TaxID=86804 RepID=A0A5C3EFX0_9BASI|nr:uncharacterized protein UTRI_04460_B [Ustilago trichophora]
MPPQLVPRAPIELDAEEGVNKRTRVDDSDPSITFNPGPSPYNDHSGTQSTWVIISDPLAYGGSAVTTNHSDASLSFTFPGDTLSVALLYKAAGTNIKLTLENGSSTPFEITAAEATASAPNGDKEAFQKKIFHLTGLPCKNHTATLSPVDGRDGNHMAMYFDWYSYASADNPTACKPNAVASATPGGAGGLPDVTDHSMEYAGIGVGAAIFGFIFALLVLLFYRRRQRRRNALPDEPDRVYRPRRVTTSDDTLNMSQRSVNPLLDPDPVFRPRGIHALAHDDSFASVHTEHRQSGVDSPSANAIFPLMPISPGDTMGRVDDIGYSIGRTLLDMRHDPHHQHQQRVSRELRRSGASKLHYEKARTSSASIAPQAFPSHSTPALFGGYTLYRIPNDTTQFVPQGSIHATNPNRNPRRPCTASAVDRLRTEARQLDVHRPLSPFDRSRPTTSAGTTTTALTTTSAQTRLTTAPANSCTHRFRRNSTSSIDTHWSRASVDVPNSNPQQQQVQSQENRLELPRPSVGGESSAAKTTDSEAEMWVSKRKIIGDGKRRRRNSSGAPRRPPRSPYRPSTGQAHAPPPLSYQPFTIS